MMKKLGEAPIFSGLSWETVERLTEHLPRKKIKQGDLIIEQGAKGNEAYILLEGKMEVFSRSTNGQTITIIFHDAPSIVGQVEIWEEYPYLASVRAIEACEVVVLSRAAYISLLHSNHQIAVNMVRHMSYLLYRTGQDHRISSFGHVNHRLANTLCSLAQLYGEEHSYGILVRKEIKKTELSDILGVARTSVIRAFENLVESKLVRFEGKYLVIPNLKALREMSSPY